VPSKADLLANVKIEEGKLVFSKDYTDTTYYHAFKDGLLEELDPPLPAELVTGYEKGPNFRRVSGEMGPAKKRKVPALDLRAELEAVEAKAKLLRAKLEQQETSERAAKIAKFKELQAELGPIDLD
jgi:hypothetical protein